MLKDLFPTSNIESVLPENSLSPTGGGVDNLAISNSSKYRTNEKIYSLVSLTRFYKSMTLLDSKVCGDIKNQDFVLPARKFNPECLVTTDGRSIIDCLMTVCDYTIIIDMDLTSRELIDHMTAFSLNDIMVCDMTKTLKLRGNFAYIFSHKSKEHYLNLKGEYIW